MKPTTTATIHATAQLEAASGVARYLSQATDAAWRALQLGIERGAAPPELRRLLAEHQRRKAGQDEAEGRSRDAPGRLPEELRQSAPASDAGGSACLVAAIELHSDEISTELSRIADAVERIADSLEGTL